MIVAVAGNNTVARNIPRPCVDRGRDEDLDMLHAASRTAWLDIARMVAAAVEVTSVSAI